MRRFADSVVAAFGMTTLCNFWMVAPLISPNHEAVYHWSGSASSLFLPVMLDFCVFWFLVTLLLLLARKPGRISVGIWCSLLISMPWILLKNWTLSTNRMTPHWFTVTT